MLKFLKKHKNDMGKLASIVLPATFFYLIIQTPFIDYLINYREEDKVSSKRKTIELRKIKGKRSKIKEFVLPTT